MNRAPSLLTPRLELRRWRESDRVPFAALNADAEVMRLMPTPLTRQESDAFSDRIEAHFEAHGFGLWAVEVKRGPPFIGFVGLSIPRFEAHFTPCVEVGWRLARSAWNRGIATEGARAALAYAFEQIGLDEIVSFTVPQNAASLRVMEKIGMWRDVEGDFDHPALPAGHALRRHVLYRLSRSDWQRSPETESAL